VQNCTEAGCSSGAVIEVELQLDETLESLSEAMFETCRKHGGISDCRVGTARPIRSASFSLEFIELDGTAAVEGNELDGLVSGQNNELAVFMNWMVRDHRNVSVGDEYSIRIVSADGGELFAQSEQVESVRQFFPNGKDCDEFPCRQAELRSLSR
jgi:hypothetical protein